MPGFLVSRFSSGAWSRFSLGMLLRHTAIWCVVLAILQSGAAGSVSIGFLFPVFALIITCELLVHVCRSIKELLLAFAFLQLPGAVFFPLLYSRWGAYFFIPSMFFWWCVKLGFVGMTLLGMFLFADRGRPSFFFIRTNANVEAWKPVRTAIVHVLTWATVAIFLWGTEGILVETDHLWLGLLRFLLLFAITETLALTLRKFALLLAAVLAIHFLVMAQAIAVELVFTGTDASYWDYWRWSVNYWLVGEFSFAGWIFLIWMLSPPEKPENLPEENSV